MRRDAKGAKALLPRMNAGGSHRSSNLDNGGERQLKAHDEEGVVVATIEADG
jgi:hypothetical protein